ncbi:hypothetical protein M8J77_012319 [Diaphorina citri]|nr:hypothetical protein M8J77_012319 [Diaphorina citri]
MKGVLFNQSVKVLSRAIHSLARIGDDMVVEPFKHGLKLSTVDKSESAYTQFWFPVSFFYSYKYDDTENPDDLRLKISFKAFLTVFKTCHSVDKTVSSCTIQIEKDIPAMIIKMQFTAGYSKTHSLFISDCVPINANYSSSGRNEIVLTARTLSNALKNFHTHQAEITLAVDSRKTIINNFDDKTLESSGQNIRSQLSLDPAEFTSYKIGLDTAINFTVREIKAMLAFAEHVSGVLKISFDEPTKPIVFNIIEAGMYEANYILATDSSETMSTLGSTGSEASSVTATRGRPVRRVLSSEESSGAEPKRVCTTDARVNANNNEGNHDRESSRDLNNGLNSNDPNNDAPFDDGRSSSQGHLNGVQNMANGTLLRPNVNSGSPKSNASVQNLTNENSAANGPTGNVNSRNSKHRQDDEGENVFDNCDTMARALSLGRKGNVSGKENTRNELGNENLSHINSGRVAEFDTVGVDMDCDEGNGTDTNRNVRRNNEPSEGSRYTSRQNHMSKQNEVSHGSSHTSKQNEVSNGCRHSSNLNRDDETFSEVHDPLLEWKKANRPNEHSHSKLSNESNNRINRENSRTSDINHENSRTSNENKSKLSHESRTRSESRNKSSDQSHSITDNPIQNGVDRSISYGLHEERENSRSHTETPERSSRENSRRKTNTRGHPETPERFGREDFRASHFVNDSGNTRSRNTTTHDSDRIESFSDAAINQFPSVHSSGEEKESQDTTMMNCYTPLNPEKLKIVFRHCLERGGEEEEGVRGKVLVYNSDDEES